MTRLQLGAFRRSVGTALVLLLLWMMAIVSPVSAVSPKQWSIPQSFNVVYEQTPLRNKTLQALLPEQVYPMRHANGSFYVCILPTQREMDQLVVQATVLSERYGDGKPVPHSISDRIDKELIGTPCVTAISNGWWSYNFCWRRHVIQFHRDAKSAVLLDDGSVNLAVFEAHDMRHHVHVLGNNTAHARSQAQASFPPALVFGTDAEGRFVGTTYGDGAWCDLRRAPRKVHIHLYCDSESRTSTDGVRFDLTESDTCEYVLRYFTKAACFSELRHSRIHQTLPCYTVAQ